MGSNATQLTALSSNVVMAALLGFFLWLLQTYTHITLPGEQVANLTVLLGALAHWLACEKLIPPIPNGDNAPAPRPSPAPVPAPAPAVPPASPLQTSITPSGA